MKTDKMFVRGIILIVFHILLTPSAQAQDENEKVRINYSGYGLGLVYPFYTINPNYYEWDVENINSGLVINGEIGKGFSSNFSVSLTPSILYSSFGKRNYRYETTDSTGQLLISYREGYRKYYHISITLPLMFEYQIGKFMNFGLGGYFMKPIIGSGKDISLGYKYYKYYPDQGFYYKYPEPIRIGTNSTFKDINKEEYVGLICKISVLLSSKDLSQNALTLSYMHSLTSDYETGYYEKWVMLSFTHRSLKVIHKKIQRKN